MFDNMKYSSLYKVRFERKSFQVIRLNYLLESLVLKKNIIFLTKVYIVKAMVFLVVMCMYENWTIKKAENLRIDAFELWCWRRLLRVPWTAKRSNQSILKEIIRRNIH